MNFKINILLFFTLFWFVLSPKEANASSAFVQCDTCGSNSAYSNVANYEGGKLIPDVNGSAEVFVSNGFGTIKKFRVAKIAGEPGLPTMQTVTEIAPTAAEQTIIEDLYALNEAIRQLLLGDSKDIPADLAGSAWDIAGSTSTANAVEDHWMYNINIFDLIGGAFGVMGTLADKIVNANYVFEMRFSDGSSATYKLTGLKENGFFDLELVLAVDEQGNTIPLNKSQALAVGEYLIQQEAQYEAMNRAMVRFSLATSGESFGAIGGGTISCRFECPDSASTCTLVCKAK
ncbi:hypothetical protein [Planctobacterium marinum]|uniref:Uncharacterized protein n=1 Tax=Planctobacterium marinum TaxID=1631968 RepID=A0AA48KR72_9ALTE|nr:hypothetical protein MACH26_27540 [Planctobacterium marinum]